MNPSPPGLVLADLPERNRLRMLQRELEGLRDTIAVLDLEIETLRSQLSQFEAMYAARLQPEHQEIQRILAWVQHLQRWTELLERDEHAPLPTTTFSTLGERIEARRGRELKEQAKAYKQNTKQAAQQETAPPPPPPDTQERLKSLYRALARRFHPDLATTEEERLHFSQLMARINVLYRSGDLERLNALREQTRGGEVDDPELPIEQQIRLLCERRDWFDAVVKNLQEERAILEQSPTCELWRNVEQARLSGRDLLIELQSQLRERVARQYDDVSDAAHCLENAVSRHNRKLTRRDSEALDIGFDPHAHKSMVQIGLEELAQQHFSAGARRLAKEVEGYAATHPSLLRLLLLTHVSALSPLPLDGLERYDDLLVRFEALSQNDDQPARFEETLVQADQLVEYGVRRATAKLAHVGLRFRHEDTRGAVLLALQQLAVRREFKRVLGVLGEHTGCSGCQQKVFAVPLYRTRGLDDLRASVCPNCGTTLRSYWMPRGKDVQAVLNNTFIDYEIVSEFTFMLGRASIAMQLVPQQVQALNLGHLKERLLRDVFTRYDIPIAAEHIQLYQGAKHQSDKTQLYRIDPPRFTVRFASDAEVGENDALELIRHRVRNKFRS